MSFHESARENNLNFKGSAKANINAHSTHGRYSPNSLISFQNIPVHIRLTNDVSFLMTERLCSNGRTIINSE
jgi:hypothetical protein